MKRGPKRTKVIPKMKGTTSKEAVTLSPVSISKTLLVERALGTNTKVSDPRGALKMTASLFHFYKSTDSTTSRRQQRRRHYFPPAFKAQLTAIPALPITAPLLTPIVTAS